MSNLTLTIRTDEGKKRAELQLFDAAGVQLGYHAVDFGAMEVSTRGIARFPTTIWPDTSSAGGRPRTWPNREGTGWPPSFICWSPVWGRTLKPRRTVTPSISAWRATPGTRWRCRGSPSCWRIRLLRRWVRGWSSAGRGWRTCRPRLTGGWRGSGKRRWRLKVEAFWGHRPASCQGRHGGLPLHRILALACSLDYDQFLRQGRHPDLRGPAGQPRLSPGIALGSRRREVPGVPDR